MTGTMLKIDITGRDGRTLKDAWHAGPRTYLGLQIPVSRICSPSPARQPVVLCNMPVAIEQHVNWVTDCIRHMRETTTPPSKPPRTGRRLDRRGQSGGRRHPFATGQPLLVPCHVPASRDLHALCRRYGPLPDDLRRGCRKRLSRFRFDQSRRRGGRRLILSPPPRRPWFDPARARCPTLMRICPPAWPKPG